MDDSKTLQQIPIKIGSYCCPIDNEELVRKSFPVQIGLDFEQKKKTFEIIRLNVLLARAIKKTSLVAFNLRGLLGVTPSGN